MKPISALLALSLLLGLGHPTSAAPLEWESDFGNEITSLTGRDDTYVHVSLSFPFPFQGTNYTRVSVGTNGGIQLGDDAGHLTYTAASNPHYFYDSANDAGLWGAGPILYAFGTDLDLGTTGTIHFKDFGDRAVFTWNEVGTYEEETHLLSFQVQLFADGRIHFSYNGILDGPGEDLVDSLDQGILVGVSGSTGVNPGVIDLTTPSETDTDTVYEIWKRENDPRNDLFDLDQKTLVFVPKPGGGFISYILGEEPTTPPVPGEPIPAPPITRKAVPDLLIGKTASTLKGDGLRNARRPSEEQTIVHSRRVFTNASAKAVLVMQNDGGAPASFRLRSSGDRYPRMEVTARASGGGSVGAAIRTGRFSRTLPGDGSVRVVYRLRTDRFYAGVMRHSDRNDTVSFRLTGAGRSDNAAMTVEYGK